MDQKQRYNQIWKHGDVQSPEIWSVWDIIKDFQGKKNLEVGPGNYPKIPIENGFFVDISESCIENLKKQKGNAIVGDIVNLPFEDEFFDLVVAIEVLEHVEDDKKAISEIARVLKPFGFFLFSVPTRKDLYGEIDQIVGHKRRYEVEELKSLLSDSGFKILKYRHPSLHQVLGESARFLRLLNMWYKSKRHINCFHLPRFLVNLYVKSMAFLDRKGTPQWQTDIENLSKYKDKSIVFFCQKTLRPLG